MRARNSLTLISYPSHITDYFYLEGTHFIQSNFTYYQSHPLNKYGFISFDKTRNFYEKISKKEFIDKKEEFQTLLNKDKKNKEKIQLILF